VADLWRLLGQHAWPGLREAYPQRCSGFILRGIFLGRQSEIDWFLHGLQNIFPEAWRKFITMLPPAERDDPCTAT